MKQQMVKHRLARVQLQRIVCDRTDGRLRRRQRAVSLARAERLVTEAIAVSEGRNREQKPDQVAGATILRRSCDQQFVRPTLADSLNRIIHGGPSWGLSFYTLWWLNQQAFSR